MEGSSAAKRPLFDTPTADRSESVGVGGGSSSLFSPTSATTSSSSSSSFKRRHSSLSSSASFKHSPSMKLSSVETVFRILCPADKTGGIIGKGGSIVRQFREETGARIRIDDPVPGSDDRVIFIVAEAPPVKKRKEAGGSGVDGDGVEEEDASPAQRALVRVFERILRVEEEERLGEEVGAGCGDEKEIQGLVMCRLLAPSSQVGCVLGKGGKIVEKMRQESGAQIRVLAKDQVPACAAAGDELIHISGSFSAVRKALLAVSGCLQCNPRTDMANFATTKPFGTILHGNGPPTQVDGFAPRGHATNLHAPEYLSRGYSSNPGMDIVASAQSRFVEEEVMFRMLCSNEKVGSLIGKAGVIVRALQSETGASIKIVDAVPDSEERLIVISARENSELKQSPAQDAVLRVHSRLTESALEKGAAASARLLVPSQQIGCLLGKGGNIIAEMRRATGASIRIFLKEHVPKCAQPNDEVVQVTGSFQSVQDALLHITSRIRETIFPLRSPSIGMTHNMSASPDMTSALFRSRNDPTSPGRYSSTGISHGPDHSSGPIPTSDWQLPFSHGLNRLGPTASDRNPYSYATETSRFRPGFDRPSLRPWTPQAISSGNHRGIPDMGLGFRSDGVGSGVQTAVMTSVTVEVVVPHQYLGYVYGENGSDLARIREISGAIVTVHDPKPGTTEGMVIISGKPDQIRAAQSLLHAFILSGKTAS